MEADGVERVAAQKIPVTYAEVSKTDYLVFVRGLGAVSALVAKLVAANGWEEASLGPVRHGRLITEAMSFRRAGADRLH